MATGRKLRIEPVGSVDVHCLSALLSNTSIPSLTLYADKSQVLETLYQIVTVADAPILLTASVSVSFSKFRSKAAATAPSPLPVLPKHHRVQDRSKVRSMRACLSMPHQRRKYQLIQSLCPFAHCAHPTRGYTRHSSSPDYTHVCPFLESGMSGVSRHPISDVHYCTSDP